MISSDKLPGWLDDCLFGQLGATYHPEYDEAEYTLPSDEARVKGYLGTYFPRSYCETLCIAANLFHNSGYYDSIKNTAQLSHEINILDIGCGTGGEIVGLLRVLDHYLPKDVKFNIYAFDCNEFALKYMSQAVSAFAAEVHPATKIVLKEQHLVQSKDDFPLMALGVAGTEFDYILCCKMCGELKSRHVVEQPYSAVASTFSARLKDNGIMLILDLTSKPKSIWCKHYLPVEMNHELNEFISSNAEFCTLVPKPCSAYPDCSEAYCYDDDDDDDDGCYMQKRFWVSHSRWSEDLSKVCYRIICKNVLRNQMHGSAPDQNRAYIIHNENTRNRRACPWFKSGNEADAFDINM